MQVFSKTLELFGQVFSKDGARPDPKRVTDLLNAAKPKNVHDVCSPLGMANYSSKYIPNFATLTAPLRDLTKKNAIFTRTEKHEVVFHKLTTALSSAPCMSYFDKKKESFVLGCWKPLEVIYSNCNSKPSARIERWVL